MSHLPHVFGEALALLFRRLSLCRAHPTDRRLLRFLLVFLLQHRLASSGDNGFNGGERLRRKARGRVVGGSQGTEEQSRVQGLVRRTGHRQTHATSTDNPRSLTAGERAGFAASTARGRPLLRLKMRHTTASTGRAPPGSALRSGNRDEWWRLS